MNLPGEGEPLTYHRLRSGLFWLIAVRLAVLAFVMAAATAWQYFGDESGISGIFFPLAGMFAFSALSAAAARRWRTGQLFVFCQLFADVFLITLIIYFTGGPISPFLFLYIPLVMVARIMFSRRIALVTAAGGAIVYASLIVGMVKGVVPVPKVGFLEQISIGGSTGQVVGLGLAMLIVALLTGFLTSLLNSSRMLIEESKRNIYELSWRQRAFIDDLPTGIITLDCSYSITSINKIAQRFLKVTEAQVQSASIFEILGGAVRSKEAFRSKVEAMEDFELSLPNGGSELKRVVCSIRLIRSADGEVSGYMIFMQDVTDLRAAEEQLEIHDRMARLFADKNLPEGSLPTAVDRFVGESSLMQKVFRLIERVAPSDATVLVNGESGTGKELVARAIHSGSSRAHGAFVALNCGAIPENLIESELFGHKKGSFTGADSDVPGLFRRAANGTIFLDEIGELPIHMQTKLLRALQERCVRPVGGDSDIPIDVRILAATNKNLREEVKAGRFRSDLFYRINVISINLPPLRERKDDIPLLVRCFLGSLVKTGATPVVPPATMKLLCEYDYPGNVRELENVLERALVLGGEVILPEHLPDCVVNRSTVVDESPGETKIIVDDNLDLPVRLDEYLAGIEMRYIKAALDLTNGKKRDAAGLLGINFRSFRYRLQKFDLDIQ